MALIKAIIFSFIFLTKIGCIYGQSYLLNLQDLNTITPDCSCKFTISGVPVKVITHSAPYKGYICTHEIMVNKDVYLSDIEILRTDFPNYENIGSLLVTAISTYAGFSVGPIDKANLLYSGWKTLWYPGESFYISNFDSMKVLRITSEGFFNLFQGQREVIDIKPIYKKAETCKDIDIEYVESMITNPANKVRKDYHEYWQETNICDSKNSDCTLNAVWDFIKTKQYYQVPTYDDFPASSASLCLPDINVANSPKNPFSGLIKAFGIVSKYGASSLDGPIGNCDKVFLAPTPARIYGGLQILFGYIPVPDISGTKLKLKLVPLPETCKSNLYTEPVKLVVDNENHRITNYTLNGHFLYPGKVERRVVIDECTGMIKVVTHGVGLTSCGDNWAGEAMRNLNICTGVHTFKNVSERLRKDFNQ